ncbi:PHP domain-containing protein [Salinirussus salinus]|uniref:PHP domain-containing protein n=1 Tax=Salinirussus salinus TaxID=1198300 RepID=UPI00135B9367|nr:PHP domain-containing protein [Salinirussus salinus]
MILSNGLADLHTHTVASDGTSTVAERVEQARDRDLPVIAITDHDCIADSLTDRVTHHDDVTVITGVEVRADLDGEKVELLGYFVDPDTPALKKVLVRAREYRTERNRTLAARLTELTDHRFDYEQLADSAPGMLGRPHFAQRLIAEGVVDSVGGAFEEYLGAEGKAYVPMERVSHERIIEALHDAGGLVSLAHPGRMNGLDVPAALTPLTEAGLDALEVRYPYGPDPALTVDEAANLADEHGLLHTGGSDCHGPGSGKFRIGDVRLPRAELEALVEAAGVELH